MFHNEDKSNSRRSKRVPAVCHFRDNGQLKLMIDGSRASNRLWSPASNGNLSNLQDLFDSSSLGQGYLTDGAANFLAASSQYLSAATPWFTSIPVSISFWVNTPDRLANYGAIALTGSVTTTPVVNVVVNTAGRIQVIMGGTTFLSTGSVPTGSWSHVVVTYDGTTVVCYINGSLSSSAAITSSGISSLTNSYIGTRQSNGSFFTGALGTTLIASGATVWTQADVTKLWNAGAGILARSVLTLGLSVNPSNGYDYTNPTISSVGIGKDSIGSINLTPTASPTYSAGPVSGTPVNGDAVSRINDISGHGNNASQTTGANRYTYNTNQINGQPALAPITLASSLYSLTTPISVIGVVTIYLVAKTTASGQTLVAVSSSSHSTTGANLNAGVPTVGSDSVSTTGGTFTTPNGNFSARFRRDANGIWYFAGTGLNEEVIGPLSGTATINQLFGGAGLTLSSGIEIALLSTQLFDVATSLNQDTQMRNYISSKFGVSLPAAVPFAFTPSQLASLNFLLDSSNNQQYTTDGAVSFNGVNQFLSTTVSPISSAPFSISLWLNFSVVANAKRVLDIGGGSGIIINTAISGVSSFKYSVNGAATFPSGSSSPTTATWYNVVLIYDGTNISAWVNGVLDLSPTASTLGTLAGGMNFGATGAGGQAITASGDTLLIAPGAWNSTDVAKIYAAGNGVGARAALVLGLTTNPTLGCDFNQPGNLGLDSIGSNTLTLNNAPTYTNGKVVGSTLVTGDAVASIVDGSVAANNASQATGANRYTFQTNQINGQPALQSLGTTGLYSLTNTIAAATGNWTLYGVVNYAAASVMYPLSNSNVIAGGSPYACLLFSNANVYSGDDTGAFANAAFGVSGKIAIRARKSGGSILFAASGFAEVNLGPFGAYTFNQIFSRQITGSTAGNQFAFLSFIFADTVTNGQDASMRAYINNKYALTIP